MIETTQLQALITVAKLGSFSRAAEELSVTQSAISQSIKTLENKVGVQLFRRNGKTVVLTQEGEKLNSLAKKFLHSLEDTVQSIREDKAGMSGKLRIGTLNGIGKSWLGRRMIEFAGEFPDITLDIKLGFPEELVHEFESFHLDGIIVPELNLPLKGEKFFISDEYSNLVFPKSFPIDKTIDLETLCQYPVIAFEHDDSMFFNWCRKHFGRNPNQIKRRYVINSHGNMLQAVTQGLGVAVLPTHVLKKSYYRDQVSTLGKEFEVSNNRFYLVIHKEALELTRVKTMQERILKESEILKL